MKKAERETKSVTNYLSSCLSMEEPDGKTVKNLPKGMKNGNPVPVVGPIPVAGLRRGRGFRFVRTARVKDYDIQPVKKLKKSCDEPVFDSVRGSYGFKTYESGKFYLSRGVVFCILRDGKGRLGIGTSFCSVSDRFDGTQGRNRALLRARQAMTLARDGDRKKSKSWKLLNNKPLRKGGQ